jgi:uncharacterized protein with WD repeat
MKDAIYVVFDPNGNLVVEFFIGHNRSVALVRKAPGVRILVAEDMNKVAIPNEDEQQGG